MNTRPLFAYRCGKPGAVLSLHSIEARFILILCVLLAITTKGFATSVPPDDKDNGKGIGFKIGYEYQNSSYLEAAVLFHQWKGIGVPLGFRGITVGAECRMGGSNLYFGPKIAVEAAALFLGGRAQLTYLTDLKNGSLVLSPEIGFSFNGNFYLYSGYNWQFSNRSKFDVQGFKLSAGINIYAIKYWRDH